MCRFMKTYKIFFVLIIIFISCLIACNKKQKKHIDLSKTTELKSIVYNFDNPPKFRKDGELMFLNPKNDTLFHINTEIVSSDTEKERGLMFRPEMEENNGMLFVMDSERIQSFWMHNCIISLDIIYVNSDYEIVDIYKNTNTQDDRSLPSAKPAKYTVEINAGLCDKYNIKIGDKIKLLQKI